MQTTIQEAGCKTEALFMIVDGTCRLEIELNDATKLKDATKGGNSASTIEIQRSVGDWFP